MGKSKDTKKREKNESGFIKIDVKPLIMWEEPNREGCIVSDRITKEGWKVGYMYRDEPMEEAPDSGWCFLKGDEDEEYMNDPSNHHVFSLNTLCNYDPDVIPYLNLPVGTALVRAKGGKFIIDDETQDIVFEKQ